MKTQVHFPNNSTYSFNELYVMRDLSMVEMRHVVKHWWTQPIQQCDSRDLSRFNNPSYLWFTWTLKPGLPAFPRSSSSQLTYIETVLAFAGSTMV